MLWLRQYAKNYLVSALKTQKKQDRVVGWHQKVLQLFHLASFMKLKMKKMPFKNDSWHMHRRIPTPPCCFQNVPK